jgi:hypothetical protein
VLGGVVDLESLDETARLAGLNRPSSAFKRILARCRFRPETRSRFTSSVSAERSSMVRFTM